MNCFLTIQSWVLVWHADVNSRTMVGDDICSHFNFWPFATELRSLSVAFIVCFNLDGRGSEVEIVTIEDTQFISSYVDYCGPIRPSDNGQCIFILCY